MNQEIAIAHIENKDMNNFYSSQAWRVLREYILTIDKHECQRCKDMGKYTKATEVHHVKEALKYPELALEPTYIDEQDNEQRQLISLCKSCHKQIHENKNKKELLNDEWFG